MEIQDFNLRRLLNNEYLAFCREFEALIEKLGPATLGVETVFGQFKTALQAFDDSIVKVRKSALTAQMRESDKLRDNYHIGILEQIQTAKRHFDPEVRAAGERMDPLLSAFQNAQLRSFDDQTGVTNNFLQELQADKYKADVEKLNLGGWIAALKEANGRCATLTSDRTGERTTQVQNQTTAVTRPLADKAYTDLVKRLNALCLINGDADYADLIPYWNTRIDHYRTVISRRLGAGKGGSTGSGDNAPNPPTGGGGGEEERPGEL